MRVVHVVGPLRGRRTQDHYLAVAMVGIARFVATGIVEAPR
jgi:hypothetical protein